MQIRKIEKKDKEKYLQMAKIFYSSPAVLSPVPEENFLRAFEYFAGGTSYGDAFIFEDNGEIIGYGVLAYTYSQEAGGKVVWLEEIYVDEAHRGKGIGSAFIDFVLNNIPAKRYRLETEPENEKATALYRRKGFEIFGYVNYKLEK